MSHFLHSGLQAIYIPIALGEMLRMLVQPPPWPPTGLEVPFTSGDTSYGVNTDVSEKMIHPLLGVSLLQCCHTWASRAGRPRPGQSSSASWTPEGGGMEA